MPAKVVRCWDGALVCILPSRAAVSNPCRFFPNPSPFQRDITVLLKQDAYIMGDARTAESWNMLCCFLVELIRRRLWFAQGGYKVAVLLSIVAFIASCRLLLYSAVAPAAWLHFAGEPLIFPRCMFSPLQVLQYEPQQGPVHCLPGTLSAGAPIFLV